MMVDLRYGVTFLLTHSGLSFLEKYFLIGEATSAYMSEQSLRRFEQDDFGGTVKVGNYASFGGITGIQFDVSLEHNNLGKIDLRFLVHESFLQRTVAEA